MISTTNEPTQLPQSMVRGVTRAKRRRGAGRRSRRKSREGRFSDLLTFNNISIAVFLTFSIGLYYPQTIMLVWLGYAVLAAAIGLTTIRIGKFPRGCGAFVATASLFGLYSLTSVTWAYNDVYAAEMVIPMLRSMALGVAIVLAVRNREEYRVALFWLAVCSVIYALFYLQFIDLTKLAAARLASSMKQEVDGLPNYNVVAMFISFGALYFIYKLVSRKRLPWWKFLFYALLTAISLTIILVFGSRKSILAVLVGFLLFFFVNANGKRKIQLLLLLAIGVVTVISLIPMEYLEYTFERMLKLTGSNARMDYADRVRIMLVENAFRFIGDAPVFGHGYYNFTDLMRRDTGIALYAHNNFLEILTDLGFIGFAIYYYFFYLIYSAWWKTRKYNPVASYIFIITGVILFNGLFIVYLDQAYMWVLIGLMYLGARGFPDDREEYRRELHEAALYRHARRLARIRKARRFAPVEGNVR